MTKELTVIDIRDCLYFPEYQLLVFDGYAAGYPDSAYVSNITVNGITKCARFTFLSFLTAAQAQAKFNVAPKRRTMQYKTKGSQNQHQTVRLVSDEVFYLHILCEVR